MSRVGLAPVKFPSSVEVSIKDAVFHAKSKKGELSLNVDPSIEINIDNGSISLSRKSDDKQVKSFHGLYRSLINNIIVGLSDGFQRDLELIGVGYRASNTGQLLELSVGFSHPIYFSVPDEVKLTTESLKGQPPTIKLESIDKELLGQVSANIRALRKPEPYKGKGIRYKGEDIRRKAGKTSAKK